MIRLGSKVKDVFTGFTGIATGRTEWLFGCTRICIEPTELTDGKPIESVWFDEQRVEVVEDKSPPVSKDSSAVSGGPKGDPTRSSDPSR
jgi:valyl-tRNA synthetase